MTEPDAAADAGEEPQDEDTPEGESDEQATETPQASAAVDWEARYKELEKVHGRQAHELGILRRGEPAEEPDDDEDDDEAEAAPEPPSREGPDRYVSRLESESWEFARQQYGDEAVDAYTAAYRVLRRAETPADHIAAFEAYHDVRSKGGTSAEAADAATTTKKPTRQQAVEPQVDLNRSDASPDLDDLEHQFAEATAKGDLGSFVRATTKALGFRK